jgi:uncharacterized membrane protein
VIFSEPIYLLLFVPLLLWTVWLGRSMRGALPARRNIAVALRIIVLSLLILALSGLQIDRINKGVATVFVLDKSASMSSEELHNADQFISRALEAQDPSDQSGLVVFGKNPVIDTETGSLHFLERIYASPDDSGTDIAAAIRLASATIPEGFAKRIVLLSDGNETTGDAADAAEAASADGIQIDTAPIFNNIAQQHEVLVQNVEAPNDVTRGEPFEMRVVVQSTGSASGTLQIDRDGEPTANIPVDLVQGPNVIAVNQIAGNPGFYRYRASLDVDNDTDPRNNVGMAFVNVVGRPRVLLVEGTPGSAAALETALKPHDIDVVRVGAAGVPTRTEDLQSYDSVILSDFPASDLMPNQMSMISSAVRDSGLGFGMIGGNNSFLPGGYYESPIADILPVDLNIRERKSFPSTCIEIVIDSSGSMGMEVDGQEKIKIAAAAAASMVRMMPSTDLVGVAGSDEDIEFVAPIQPCVDKDKIAAECGTLEAGDAGIFIEPSLEFAQKSLTPIKTQVRHLIIESDGDDAKGQDGAYALAQQMVSQGMTISVIAIGDGKDTGWLRGLAAVGHGYYYLADHMDKLQSLVTADSSLTTRSAIEEGAFIPKVDPTDEVLRGLDLQSMPPLYAYDLTSDRALARTPMRTNKDDPLLAYWQYGLGTSMAFTSDSQPKWARPWMNWSGFNAFWAQAIRSTMRQKSSDQLRIDTHLSGGKGVLDLTAYDSTGAAINNLAAKVNVIAPDGVTQPVTIEQTGPGKYSGTFDAGQTGGYIITASQQSAPGAKPLITRSGFAIAYPPEYQSVGPNTALLAQIANITGGINLANPIDAFRSSPRPGESIQDLWPALLLAAGLLFVLDVAVRRLAIPLEDIKELFFGLTSRLPGFHGLRGRSKTRKSTASESIARLNEVKRRVPTAKREQSEPADTLENLTVTGSSRPEQVAETKAESPQAPEREPSEKPLADSPPATTAERLLELKRRSRNGSKNE